MRIPVKQGGPASLRAARPTPNYGDEVSEEFIAKQTAYIEAQHGGKLELTPVTADAW